jgi:hypothetical protein
MKREIVISFITSIALISFLLLISFGTELKKSSEKTDINTLSKKEIQEDWKLLFDGKTLDGWMLVKPDSWIVEDGTISCKGGGYIWTKERFGDFILDLEYKVSPMCNSGVFFRTANLKDPVQTGIEMQVLDPASQKETGKNGCGSIYDCLAVSTNSSMKPAGEWNRVIITCKDNLINIVMNDKKIIDMDLNKWTEPNKNLDGTKNKFNKALKDFSREGHIGFQDHGSPVWYRSVKIKKL